MAMNDFNECLVLSENKEVEDLFIKAYHKAFYNITNIMYGRKDYCRTQKSGIDRIIYLENFKVITIDEKVRKKNYDDFALEFISNDKKNTPGWIEKDLSIDYIAYGFLESKTVYLLEWQLLKRSWNNFKDIWKEKYFIAKAENKGYTTYSVCVPIKEVLNIVKNASIIKQETTSQ